VTSVQPGGGPVQTATRVYLRLRRAWLRALRPGYVAQQRTARVTDCAACPHDVLDAVDLLAVRNVCRVRFAPECDVSPWRDRCGLVRLGRPELVATCLLGAGLAAGLAVLHPLAAAPALLLPAFGAWFFRDPERTPPADPLALLAPADGRLDDLRTEPECPFFAGPAIRLGIFLSLLDVHVNRAPCAARAVRFAYRPGQRRATYRIGLTDANEQLVTWFAADPAGTRVAVVRQVAGPAARRICNVLHAGEPVAAGARFGLIKFGSRTELWLPAEQVEVTARLGERVRGGETVLARWR
jgi:phosphatidylserine decarboxylase